MSGAESTQPNLAEQYPPSHIYGFENPIQLIRLIDALPGIVFICANAPDWPMQYLSRGCLKVTGYSSEELLQGGGTAFNDITHPQDLPKVMNAIATAIAQEQPYTIEYRIRTKSGQERWLWEKGSGVFDAHHQLLNIEGCITDITPLKQAEARRQLTEMALAEREAHWRSLIQNSSDLITILNADAAVRYHSPALTKLLGYLPQERIGQDAFELVHPDDIALVRQTFQRVLLHPKLSLSSQYRCRHQDGSWRYLESTGANLLADPAVAGIVINSRDITERKLSEINLKYQIEFAHLVTTLATRFINIACNEIDRCIHIVLAEIGQFGQADRSYIFRISDHGRIINNTHEWCAVGIQSGREQSQNLVLDQLPYLAERLRRLETVHLPCVSVLHEDSLFRQVLEQQDIQSLLVVPMILSNQLVGFLGFDRVQTQAAWPEEIISLLKVVAEIVVNALERQQAESQLLQTTCELQAIFQALPDLYFRVDQRGVILDYKAGRRSDLYVPPEEFMGKSMLDILPVEVAAQIQHALTRLNLGESRIDLEYSLSLPHGLQFYEARLLRFFQDQVMVVVRNISDRKQAENELRHQAFHDLLTGLPNRALLDDRLQLSLADARRNGEMLAVMFMDLDRFKTINDTLGHTFGDQLLQQVAERVMQSLRDVDTIARWGGDEFTLLLPHLYHAEDAVNIAERILYSLKPTFTIEGQNLHVACSLGIAIYPWDGEDSATLLRNADAALYQAKAEGRNRYQLFNATLSSHSSDLLKLENQLHRAIENQELVVYYQPQINTQTGEMMRVEALVRWQHPQQGLIPPQTFITLAEENGLILPIGEWVLQTACRQCWEWQQMGFSELGVSVNLSARQFQQPNLVQAIAEILSQTGLLPQSLELEITETTAMSNVEFTRTLLLNLSQMGVGISLDDFGTGYSSLGYLKRFPLNALKIDRTFIRDLPNDPQDLAITSAVIALGRGLNLSVVAEGVETEAQRQILASLNCEAMQGYLFSPPLPAAAMTEVLSQFYCQNMNIV